MIWVRLPLNGPMVGVNIASNTLACISARMGLLPQDVGDGVPESVARTLACLSEQRLEFGESLLDGIEVGAVGRQINQFGSHALDCLPDPGHLVAGQVFHYDGFAGAERRGEELFALGSEGWAGPGALQVIGVGAAAGPPGRAGRGLVSK